MAASIADSFGEMAGDSGLLSAFKAAFNGSAKAMSAALGFKSTRSVERYYTAGKEKRAPSPATRAKMAKFVPVEVRFTGRICLSKDCRDRDVKFKMSQKRTQEVAQHLAAGKDERAFEFVWENYFIPDTAIGQYTFTPVR